MLTCSNRLPCLLSYIVVVYIIAILRVAFLHYSHVPWFPLLKLCSIAEATDWWKYSNCRQKLWCLTETLLHFIKILSVLVVLKACKLPFVMNQKAMSKHVASRLLSHKILASMGLLQIVICTQGSLEPSEHSVLVI